jgi:hypothetical protein
MMKSIRDKVFAAALFAALLAAFAFAGCEQAPGPLSTGEETPPQEQLPPPEEETPPDEETPAEEETPEEETPEEETPPEPGSDAALKSLELSAGSLDPAFNPQKTAYTAAVANAVDSITVTGVPRASAATVAGDNGTPKALEVGENPPIAVVVTAEDAVTQRTYTVTVTRLGPSVISVNSAEDLAKIGRDPAWPAAGSYKLAADITLENWVPVGADKAGAFTGNFDGDDKKITLKSFDESVFLDKRTHLGVFGYVRGSADSKALIKNLKLRTEI